MDGTEQQPDNMKAKNSDKFNAVFETPTSAYNSDGFFGSATPGSFVPYMNLKSQANTAIVTTPEKARALVNLNNQLAKPYEIKGAYII